MAVPSKSSSRALVKDAEGSPRNRIYGISCLSWLPCGFGETYPGLLGGIELLGPSLHATDS